MAKPNLKDLTAKLLPYFPDNVWLKKQWWHRVALVISYLWVGVWWLVGFFGFIFGDTSGHAWEFLLFIVVCIFTPSIIYRILLYITTNNKWKMKAK